mgnify:CR=1 FL=1
MAAIVVASHMTATNAIAQTLNERYNARRPLVVACDWDKPPYEFLNDEGKPDGSNIDVIRAIMKQVNIPCRFVMKEWGNAIKTFERGDADIILAHTQRFRRKPYYVSQNIINYNRIVVAMKGDTATHVTLRELDRAGAVFKPSDYAVKYFIGRDSSRAMRVEYQSPKTALMGVVVGDNKYFVWGEEPLRWKIKELNVEDIVLSSTNIPVSEIHVIGRDRELIEEIDDQYSRLKQSGEIEQINNKWLHPDKTRHKEVPMVLIIGLLAIMLAALFYALSRLARQQVRNTTNNLTDVNNMMYKALHMGNFHVMEYNIAEDRMTNRYGHILPEEGLSLEEFTQRIHPSEQEDFKKKMERMTLQRSRHELLRKHWNAGTDEQPRWLTFDGHALSETDDEGRPMYIVNAVHDITNGLAEEQASHEIEKRYKCLFDMPFVAMAFYDKNGTLIDLNDAMRKLCGFEDSSNERFWQSAGLFDIPLFRDAYAPGDTHNLYVCQHMVYADMGIDRYVEIHVCPIFNREGELVNYFTSCIDLTASHNDERELQLIDKEIQQTNNKIKELEGKLQYMLESTNMYIWQLDFKTKTITWSRSLSKPDHVCSFDEYIDCVNDSEQENMRTMMENPGMWGKDFINQRQLKKAIVGGGEGERCYQLSGISQYDAEGNVTGIFGLLRDITSLINTQQRLREETQRAEDSGRQKSMFLASMTHELRTPLNAIVGFSDLLSTVDTKEERREFIKIIRSSCDMLMRLISDILEITTISDDPMSFVPADIDFAKLFNEMCLALEQRVENPNVTFIKDNPYDTLPVRLDAARIQQVVTNFVTNAVKHTSNGHIKLGYKTERRNNSNGLYIYCEDTGTGIPADKQKAIFERFVKLDEFVQGTGLGLAICKSIADRCKGQVGVESQGEGHGSTFYLWVPTGK